ncbi:MAG: flagellar hook-basal body complex protein FliE [Planctomycetota bacterium]
MVDRIGSGGSLQREAILAALRNQAKAGAEVRDASSAVSESVSGRAKEAGGIDFAESLREGLRDVEGEIRSAERLPEDLVAGEITDFHEVAARIKRADLSLKFALEIRNKLIDAYREVMRMQV